LSASVGVRVSVRAGVSRCTKPSASSLQYSQAVVQAVVQTDAQAIVQDIAQAVQ
jgi:hypothetical protein